LVASALSSGSGGPEKQTMWGDGLFILAQRVEMHPEDIRGEDEEKLLMSELAMTMTSTEFHLLFISSV